MRFPQWEIYTSKIKEWEKYIHGQINEHITKKITNIEDQHPLISKLFTTSLKFLPSPFNEIAQSIYDNFKGSEEDRLLEVEKFLINLEKQGQVHYEIFTNKLDSALVGISDLKELGGNILNIQEALQSSVDNIDQKVDQIKILTEDVRTKIDSSHNDLMKYRWEKEKTAFILGENIVKMSMSPNAPENITADKFLSFCQNLNIHLSKDEEQILRNINTNQSKAVEFYSLFNRKVELAVDIDLLSAYIIGDNVILLISILNSTDNITPSITHIYKNFIKCRKGLANGGYVMKTVDFLILTLEQFQNFEIPIEKRHEIQKDIVENVGRIMEFN
jgi:hypothetical protein